jgi:hypothetical protein
MSARDRFTPDHWTAVVDAPAGVRPGSGRGRPAGGSVRALEAFETTVVKAPEEQLIDELGEAPGTFELDA